MIFSDIQRTDSSEKAVDESRYDFYNRSAWSVIESKRLLLERLISEYPKQYVGDLIYRMKCGNEIEFDSAEFELLLYRALITSGYRLTPHPTLNNGSEKRPDFLVECCDGSSFYMEAVLCSTKTQNPLIRDTINALKSVRHPNFMVSVKPLEPPSAQPNRRKLKHDVLSWLNTLNADQLLLNNQVHKKPICRWPYEKPIIELVATPIMKEHRGKSRCILGIVRVPYENFNNWQQLRDTLKAKGQKYGSLDRPLIIAINFQGRYLDDRDEFQALYGEEKIACSIDNLDSPLQTIHEPNGLWRGRDRPEYTRVSGVWFFHKFNLDDYLSKEPRLYFNHWAAFELPKNLRDFSHVSISNDKLDLVQGISFGSLVGTN
jgi:hypothetical protein